MTVGLNVILDEAALSDRGDVVGDLSADLTVGAPREEVLAPWDLPLIRVGVATQAARVRVDDAADVIDPAPGVDRAVTVAATRMADRRQHPREKLHWCRRRLLPRA